MKSKIILITCVIFIKSISALASSTETVNLGIANLEKKLPFDTLQWVQTNIINNKQNFIDREFSVLLNALPIPLKSYYTISPENAVGNITSIGVSFLPSFEAYADNYPPVMFPVRLIIVWQTPIPMIEYDSIGYASKGVWGNAENQFFGNRIVADIFLVDFSR